MSKTAIPKFEGKTKDGRTVAGYPVPVNYGLPVIVRAAYQNEDGSIEWVYEPVIPDSISVYTENGGGV